MISSPAFAGISATCSHPRELRGSRKGALLPSRRATRRHLVGNSKAARYSRKRRHWTSDLKSEKAASPSRSEKIAGRTIPNPRDGLKLQAFLKKQRRAKSHRPALQSRHNRSFHLSGGGLKHQQHAVARQALPNRVIDIHIRNVTLL